MHNNTFLKIVLLLFVINISAQSIPTVSLGRAVVMKKMMAEGNQAEVTNWLYGSDDPMYQPNRPVAFEYDGPTNSYYVAWLTKCNNIYKHNANQLSTIAASTTVFTTDCNDNPSSHATIRGLFDYNGQIILWAAKNNTHIQGYTFFSNNMSISTSPTVTPVATNSDANFFPGKPTVDLVVPASFLQIPKDTNQPILINSQTGVINLDPNYPSFYAGFLKSTEANRVVGGGITNDVYDNVVNWDVFSKTFRGVNKQVEPKYSEWEVSGYCQMEWSDYFRYLPQQLTLSIPNVGEVTHDYSQFSHTIQVAPFPTSGGNGYLLAAAEDGLLWIYNQKSHMYIGLDTRCSGEESCADPWGTLPPNTTLYCTSAAHTPDFLPTGTGWPTNLGDICMRPAGLNVIYSDYKATSGLASCDSSVETTPRAIISRTWNISNACGRSISGVQKITLSGLGLMTLGDVNEFQEAGLPIHPVVNDCYQQFDAFNQEYSGANIVVTTLHIFEQCNLSNKAVKQEMRNYSWSGCTGQQQIDPSNNYKIITVVDTTGPQIVAANMEYPSCSIPSVSATATVTDNFDDVVTITYEDEILSDFRNKYCPPNKTMLVIKRTIVATDSCGNSNKASQILTFVDTTAPTFTSSIFVTCKCVSYTDPVGYRGCGHPTNIYDECGISPNSDVYLGNGVNPYPFRSSCLSAPFASTWTIFDLCGNNHSAMGIIVPN